jgi:hypothetical protein
MVMKLAIGEDVRVQPAAVIHHRAPVNAHLRQNALNEFQVRFRHWAISSLGSQD